VQGTDVPVRRLQSDCSTDSKESKSELKESTEE
jgi:hypothetical protein